MKAALLVVVVAGCAGSGAPPIVGQPPDPPDATCVDRIGSYRVHYAQQSGTCPPLPDAVVQLSNGGAPPDGCMGNQQISDDRCAAQTFLLCTGTDGATAYDGSVNWAKDATQGQGSVTVVFTPRTLTPAEEYARSIYGGPPLQQACHATYGVEYTRL